MVKHACVHGRRLGEAKAAHPSLIHRERSACQQGYSTHGPRLRFQGFVCSLRCVSMIGSYLCLYIVLACTSPDSMTGGFPRMSNTSTGRQLLFYGMIVRRLEYTQLLCESYGSPHTMHKSSLPGNSVSRLQDFMPKQGVVMFGA